MIKINLLGDDTQSDNANSFLIAGYFGSIVLTAVLFLYLNNSIGGEVQELKGQRRSLEGQLAQLKETTREVRELEDKRKDLQSKLSVIALLTRNKVGPVRVMDELNIAIPERAWITEIAERSGKAKITGLALDNVTVSRFAQQLGQSDFFAPVDRVQSKSIDWKGAAIQQFDFEVKVNYAGRLIPAAAPVSAEKPAETTEKSKKS